MAKPALILAAAALAALGGCTEPRTGPVVVSAIGSGPELRNPNLRLLDPPAAFLAEAIAQGLVRFDAAGEIEPALAQSWIVSDDGRRYTFRIRRVDWAGGGRVTAEQVAARLRAAFSRASRNPLKPMLGSIESVVAMTDEVLEISLRGPRPNLLQLLAQPEMAIMLGQSGTGPYRVAGVSAGNPLLAFPPGEEDEDETEDTSAAILLRGERVGLAVARFALRDADLVTGGTLGDLPIARAAGLPGNRLAIDPTQGLFGLAFASAEGPLADPAVRQALSMAIDRNAIAQAIGLTGFVPRTSLLPTGLAEQPQPAVPDWADSPQPMRRELASRTIATSVGDGPLRLRVAMPDQPGYRILFAYLRRDWRAIGVEAERVAPGSEAELRLLDAVAPALMASWYLRHFTCDSARICEPEADEALLAARLAPTLRERQEALGKADGALTRLAPFIPIAAPVRWSLVSQRLNGFRANAFGRHAPSELIAEGS